MSQSHTRRLIIVDDRADVLRSLARYLREHVETVYTAATVEEAERILSEHQPDTLLCDYWLGDDLPTGTELCQRWRSTFSCLRRVALMTGTKGSAVFGAQHVDVVFEKPIDLAALRRFLLPPS